MEELKLESQRIDASLENLAREALNQKNAITQRLHELNEEYKKTKADGDLRENAGYEDALKGIQEANGDLQMWEALLDGINNVKSKLKNYVHQERITSLSTVKLQRTGSASAMSIDGIDDVLIFKLFPYGISDIKHGILSIDSVIGTKLLDKQVGETIKFRDRTSSKFANYVISEFF